MDIGGVAIDDGVDDTGSDDEAADTGSDDEADDTGSDDEADDDDATAGDDPTARLEPAGLPVDDGSVIGAAEVTDAEVGAVLVAGVVLATTAVPLLELQPDTRARARASIGAVR